MTLAFSKMHGIGNDMVVVDARVQPLRLSATRIAALGDRHRGIGFDQLMVLEPARSPGALASYRIFNRDGSAARQCGNGVRCLAQWLQRHGEADAGELQLDAPDSRVSLRRGDHHWAADMGLPAFEPASIPLILGQADHYSLSYQGRPLRFAALSMGNPHAVIEVANVAGAKVQQIGSWLSRQLEFPEGCNVGFVERIDDTKVALRVHERGAGETLACGSGACAAVAAMQRWDKVTNEVEVDLPGGRLSIRRDPDNGHLWMSGPTEFVFDGELPDD